MPSELRRPDLPDTPEMFARIEAGLREEAAALHSRHQARMRRAPWYQSLRPAMGAALAASALVLLVPAYLTPRAVSPPETPTEVSVVSAGSQAGSGFLHRLPSDDLAAITPAPYRYPRPAPSSDMLRLSPA